MKILGLITILLLAGCTHTPDVKTEANEKLCTKKCKKPYALGSKYQQKQKQKRCEKRCKNTEEESVDVIK